MTGRTARSWTTWRVSRAIRRPGIATYVAPTGMSVATGNPVALVLRVSRLASLLRGVSVAIGNIVALVLRGRDLRRSYGGYRSRSGTLLRWFCGYRDLRR